MLDLFYLKYANVHLRHMRGGGGGGGGGGGPGGYMYSDHCNPLIV